MKSTTIQLLKKTIHDFINSSNDHHFIQQIILTVDVLEKADVLVDCSVHGSPSL